jgi:PTH1 family peptidyl-tRNA hydrolase
MLFHFTAFPFLRAEMISSYRFYSSSPYILPVLFANIYQKAGISSSGFTLFIMKLLVGLGNPESVHVGTRHNIGFCAAEKIADSFGTKFTKGKGKYLEAKISHRREQVTIIKPMTYMNLSGHAVVAAMNFYKIGQNDILVMCDDLNLPSGSIRLRAKGSAGGQNGLKHIIESLGSEEFARMRIGIRPDDQPLHSFSSFVLGKFSEEEKKTMEKILPTCCDAALDFAINGIEHAMNNYNKPVI